VQAQRPSSGDQVPERSGILEVYVRELNQLFDSMDPSPFQEKCLDRAAEEYIVAAAKELRTGAPAALVVYLDKEPGSPDEGQALGEAIRKHFARRAQLLRWELRRLIRRGSISLVIGLTALAAALAAGDYLMRALGAGHLATLLGQSLHIGGWVAMWHPIEIFLYEWWPLLSNRRLYERLSRMPVQIVYTGQIPVDADVVADVAIKQGRNGRAAPAPVPAHVMGAGPRGV
jgi:hypothetical protein